MPPIITAARDILAAPVSASLLVLNEVVRKLDPKAARKGNFVISGLRLSFTRYDSVAVADFLCTELKITANVTYCVRLSKPTDDNHPCPLLATLSSDTDSSTVIPSTTKIRSSIDAHVRENVYINADLIQEQRKLDFNLRCELKRLVQQQSSTS